MGALDQTFANAILDAAFDETGAAVRLATGPFKLLIMTANGSATAAGTELASGGSYVAGTGIALAATDMAAAASGAKSNSSVLSQTNMPTASNLNGVEIKDSAGSPARKWWGALTGAPKSTTLGDTFSIAASALQTSFP